MGVVFQASGIREVRNHLNAVAKRLRDTRPVRKSLGEELLVRNHHRMRAGRDIEGLPFKASRRSGMFGGQTMFDRGNLLASLDWAVPGNDLEFFSTDKRARVHWEGLEIRPTNGHQFLTIPLRGTGGLFQQSGGAAPMSNRTGMFAGNFAKKTTFFRRRGALLFLMQRIRKDSGTYVAHKRGRKDTPASGRYAVRALFLLLRSTKMVERKWFGFGRRDIEDAGSSLADYVTTGRLS